MSRLYDLQFITFALVKFEIHVALFIQCHFILFNDKNRLSFYVKDVNDCAGHPTMDDLHLIELIYFSFHFYAPLEILNYLFVLFLSLSRFIICTVCVFCIIDFLHDMSGQSTHP